MVTLAVDLSSAATCVSVSVDSMEAARNVCKGFICSSRILHVDEALQQTCKVDLPSLISQGGHKCLLLNSLTRVSVDIIVFVDIVRLQEFDGISSRAAPCHCGLYRLDVCSIVSCDLICE